MEDSKSVAVESNEYYPLLCNSVKICSDYLALDRNVLFEFRRNLDPSTQSVYLEIYSRTVGWQRDVCYVTDRSLMKSCNIKTPNTIRKSIQILQRKKLIEVLYSKTHFGRIIRINIAKLRSIKYLGILPFTSNSQKRLASDNLLMLPIESQLYFSKYLETSENQIMLKINIINELTKSEPAVKKVILDSLLRILEKNHNLQPVEIKDDLIMLKINILKNDTSNNQYMEIRNSRESLSKAKMRRYPKQKELENIKDILNRLNPQIKKS